METNELLQASEQPVAMTREELERTMRMLEPMYDIVRIVDPSLTQGRTLDKDGGLALPHQCFDVLKKGRRCKNCISARTVACGRSVSKFEFVGKDAFYISTRYVVVDGEPRSVELVKQITDETFVPSADDTSSAAQEMRDLVEGSADRRYLDAQTGVYNERYLREGISSLRGSRVALLQAACLAPDGEEHPKGHAFALTAVARTIANNIRDADTLVRLKDDSFAVIFERIPLRIFPTRLDRILSQVAKALGASADAGDVLIGAVASEGYVSDLLEQARNALGTADPKRPIVLLGASAEDDPGYDHDEELTGAPALGRRARAVDALTGLPLPYVFRARLELLINDLDEGEAMSVVHVDIENFKAFNRTYGLAEGDVLLSQVAAMVRTAFPNDLVTRAGIDTFDIATFRSDVPECIARIRKRLRTLRRDVNLELKAGVCVVDVPLSATSAIDRAKIACDSTKGKFDLVLRTFDGKLEHRILASDHIVKSLDTAIEKGYIQPYYQPIVRSFTGKVCSIEALSRWIDPDRGLLSPADVIPTLEDRHLIHHHDVHIVRCVCRDLRAMMDANMPVVPVSVNLSRLDFQLCDIFDAVERAMDEFDIPRSLLDIEVTESTLDTSNAFFRPQIERFRAAGHEIWMDDFGSGYSSLNLLKDYDFDVLKIDMAFLYGLESNHNSQEIVSSVVDMAKRLGIRTLAEGVETDAQREFLRGIGCEMVQGYLFSRPVPFSSLAHGLSLGFESLENREYYESVGRVNLLSQQPDEALRPLGGDAVGRGMPLAVVEWDGRSCHYFLANEAYQRNLCRLGFARTEDAAKTLSRNAAMLSALEVMAHGPANSRDEMLVRYTVNGLERTTMVQFVARCDRGAAFLVRPQSMIA